MITYDYAVLDEAISMMTAKAEQIRQLTDDQQKSAMQTLVDWKGASADAYNKLCDDLEADLKANIDILNNLKQKMHQGVEEMQLTDTQGGKHIYS